MSKNLWVYVRKLLPVSALAALLVALASPGSALAQVGPEPTAISLGAPTTATLGEMVTLQARLIDSAGSPIARAKVSFVSPQRFLNVDDEVVVAEGVTDEQGLAVADWQVRTSGDLTVEAVFRGNERYAPSKAAAQMRVVGDRQLYVEDRGVQVPGLNVAPVAAAEPLWPRLNAWPIVLALLVVWSLYLRVAVLLLQVVRQGAWASAMSHRQAAAAPAPISGGADGDSDAVQAGPPTREPEASS